MRWLSGIRQRFGTLRWRIALWIAAFVALTLALLGVSAYLSVTQKLHAMVDDTLRLSAIQIAAAVDIEDGRIWPYEGLQELAPAASGFGGGNLLIRLYDQDGVQLAEFGPPGSNLAALPTPDPSAGFATLVQADGQVVRTYTTSLQDNDHVVGTLQVGEDLRLVRGALDRLSAALTLGALLLIVASVAGGYFLAGRALAPVDQITRTVQHISTHDLAARLNLTGDDELGRLASTLDAMLNRLEEGFRRERQFTADASHELRTPLAAMQAILDVVRARPRSTSQYRQALDDIAEETDRLQNLVGGLLQLARSDAAIGAPVYAPVDLAQLLKDVCESMQPLAEVKGLVLVCETPRVFMVAGDSDELVRMFVNLVDNAIKYTDTGSIKIDAVACEDGWRVTVADSGPGIAPKHLPHVFDRFYRADAARSLPGAGLGLAIAAEIASAHGGAIDVTSAPCVGTKFVVTLPRG
jgi:heavy metal sensor kinase